MNAIVKITLFGIRDLLRNRWALIYSLFFLVVSAGFSRMVADSSKVTLNLMNLTLFLVPLVSVVFGTMYFYNSRPFVELLLSQPIRRSAVYLGMFASLSLSLAFSFTLGVLIPLLPRLVSHPSQLSSVAVLLLIGSCLTFVFVGLAFLVSVLVEDKGKGLGVAILMWLFFSVVYDGLILFSAHLFSDYPLEKPMILAAVFNPVDLARMILMIKVDIAALMGYTGAMFQRFFGSELGMVISLSSLFLWWLLPLGLGVRYFGRKDF
jgi:Cu-processing system permease protein